MWNNIVEFPDVSQLPERQRIVTMNLISPEWFAAYGSRIDPLTCGACGARMRIVSFITDPRVIDRILRHRQSDRCRTEDPFESRAPPLSRLPTLQRACIDDPNTGP